MGQLNVANCVAVVDGKGGFTVTVPGRTLKCKAGSAQDATKWVELIRGEDPSQGQVLIGGEDNGVSTSAAVNSRGATGGSTAPSSKLQYKPETHQKLAENITLFRSESTSGNLFK